MININANLDLKAFEKIETQRINDLLRDMLKDPLNITFIAREEEFKPWISRKKGESFMGVILPYDEVINNEDNLPLMLTYLAQNVHRLRWLDHIALKEKIEKVLIAESTPEAKAGRMEEALDWKPKRLSSIKHMEDVLNGVPIKGIVDQNQTYDPPIWDEEEE